MATRSNDLDLLVQASLGVAALVLGAPGKSSGVALACASVHE